MTESHIIVRFTVSVSVLVLLSVISGLYAMNINKTSEKTDTDGATAVRVVIGVLYTGAGIVLIVTAWFGLRHALQFAIIYMAAFTFAGIPHYFSDASRDRDNRTGR